MNKYQEIIDFFSLLSENYKTCLGIQDFVLRIEDFPYTNDPEANSYCIRIPLQYIHLIELNCNLILGNRNLFKSIGSYQNEILNQENFKMKESIFTCNEFMSLNNLNIESIKEIPQDQERNLVSNYLSQIIISFIAFHELGHVRQHNYPSTKDKEDYSEFDSKGSDLLKQQAAEFDADVFGINFFCDHLFFIMDNNWDKNPMRSIIKTRKKFLIISVYSLLLFFYLSNSDEQIYNAKKKHPHPIVRLDYCAIYIMEKCLSNGIIENSKEFSKLMQEAIWDFDATLSYHFGLPDNSLYYERFKHPDVYRSKVIITEYVAKDKSLNSNRPYDLALRY